MTANSRVWQTLRGLTSLILPLVLISVNLAAQSPAASGAEQTHVVTADELHRAAVGQSEARQRNADSVERFLSTPRAQDALRSLGVNMIQVKAAVSALDDGELARLAATSEKARADMVAGNLSDHDLLIILIVVVAVIVIVLAAR